MYSRDRIRNKIRIYCINKEGVRNKIYEQVKRDLINSLVDRLWAGHPGSLIHNGTVRTRVMLMDSIFQTSVALSNELSST